MKQSHSSQKTDNELIQDFLEQDSTLAVEALINRYYKKLLNAILFLTKNQAQAEDLSQDIWIKILDKLRAGKYTEGNFPGWAQRIAYTTCIDFLRKQKRQKTFATPPGHDHLRGSFAHEDNQPDQLLIKDETRYRVRAFVDALPLEQKEIVLLRHYADLKFSEIAQLLDISINTALGRMRYALINMRKMIDQQKNGLM
ncbi:sigma-70 family RNA polymerase sigma factor [Candidatus Nomurabacteria bacterium]|nr:sigma-70 family RNA polymerase sigma factor [Candidatus Nomurabacteria bacterium]